MASLRRTWTLNRPIPERHYLALASYNSGTGNILKAQTACHDASLWADISPCLPRVTGSLAAQTIGYVASIKKWRTELQ